MAGYQGQRGWNPVGLGAAIAINGGVLAVLILATTTPKVFVDPWKPIEAINIPIDPPPPPPLPMDEPKPVDRAMADPAPTRPLYIPSAPFPARGPVIESSDVLPPTTAVHVGPISVTDGSGLSGWKPAETPAPPVLVDAVIDPRYRAGFQPDYPAFERNQGRDGMVTVRVLVGSDGRVAAVEQVRATSTAFFEATKRRALSKWRFRPATRDGVAVESWREMTVRFTMEDA